MSYPDTESRVIQLHGQVLRYTLVRRRRRTVGFKVDQKGLTVAAPAREPYRHLDQLLTENAEWIVNKLKKMEAQRLPERKWVSGERLPLLGDSLDLYLYRTYTRSEPMKWGERFFVGVPDVKNAAQVKQSVAGWYRREALRCFQERINLFAPRLGVDLPPVKLSEAKTTWGMCMPNGEIRLSWRLIKAPLPQIDYVVAHELAHLRHMNHSRAFWHTVAAIFPDYEAQRAALERDGYCYHTF